ncbi:MAG: hypothetical protein KJ964_03120, partial [Verrucomicrobia bacterium]|nr:hypothetical protein [Verrucomicrobiota bacterium]
MKKNARPILIAALLFGMLFQTAFGIVSAQQLDFDPRYLANLKDMGIRFFQRQVVREIPSMRYDEAYNISHANQAEFPAERLADIYKNHMQLTIRFNDIYHKGWGRGGSSTPIGALKYDNKGNITGVIDELNTVQAYCDFWLENYMKPMLKSRYEQGIYLFGVAAESYWLIYDTQVNLTKLFPYHDFHEFEGLSDAAKEVRIRAIVEDTHKRLYEWKNENYPKMIFSIAWAYTHSTENMLKCVRDIPWVDWFFTNGGGPEPMIGTNPFGPGGGRYHYPIFKQMIETDNFAYTNYDGTIETRQSRGWGCGNGETSVSDATPGTPQQYLKLPEQYADTRYYDHEIQPGLLNNFQKFMSEYSALDRGNNYIKYHSPINVYPRINSSEQNWLWQLLYPTTFFDNNLPAGARYHADNQVDELIEKQILSGKLYVDNFSLKKAGVEISREGDFENVVPSAWEVRGIKDMATKISFQSPANGKTARIFLKTSEGTGRHLFTDIKVYESEKIVNGGFELITGDQIVAWQGNLVDWVRTDQGYSAVVASGADCYQDIVLTPGLNYNFYCVIQGQDSQATAKVTVIHYNNEQIIGQQDYTKWANTSPSWGGLGFTFLCPANATKSRMLITATDTTPVNFDLASLTAENLIVNGKFQDGKNGWSPDSEMVTNGATTYLINGSDMDSYQDIAIQSNKDYSASYIIRNGGSAYQGGCVIKFYDSQGLEITNSQLIKAVNPKTYVAHAEGLGVGGSRGLLCTDGCQVAAQICGSNLGNCRLDFTVMAKGGKTYSKSPVWLGVYWEGYNSVGGLLQKGKALSLAGPDGKFWHMPVTESYASYSGYIQTTNNNVDYVKVYIYSTDWKNYAGYSTDAGLMAVAHCFNGPYGYEENTNTFVFTNKITSLAESAYSSKYRFMKEEMHKPGGRLYDVWGGLQWPLVVKGENISYDPDTGRIKIIVRNVSAENSLSAPVHVFARDKNAGPAWNTGMYIKAKPENIRNSLILADRIAYNSGDYAVPGPSATTDDPLTSGDNALELTFTPSGTVANGQRIYVYIEDTPTVKGWTAFNDLPECFISITERDEYLEITAQAADENGIKRIELEYSLDGGANWNALTSVNADYLSATFNKTVCAVAFR